MSDPLRRLPESQLPYLVAAPALAQRLGFAVAPPAPSAHGVRPRLYLDPTRRASAGFLRRLEHLDALTYGPLQLAMPRWAFYDCAELPGCVFGLARPARDLAPETAAHFGLACDSAEPVPVSMCMAVPMLGEARWLIFALCELPTPEHEPGLRPHTLALALELLGAREVTAPVQWASSVLGIWARLAPLALLAAWVPAHSEPATCVLRARVDPGSLARRLAQLPPEPPPGAEWLELGDTAALRELQRTIEGGREVTVVGAARDRAGRPSVPLRYAART